VSFFNNFFGFRRLLDAFFVYFFTLELFDSPEPPERANFLYFLTHTLSILNHTQTPHYKKKMFSLTSTVASAKLTSKVRTVEPILRARSRFACAFSTTLSEIFFVLFFNRSA